jgi:hypothetical protein
MLVNGPQGTQTPKLDQRSRSFAVLRMTGFLIPARPGLQADRDFLAER